MHVSGPIRQIAAGELTVGTSRNSASIRQPVCCGSVPPGASATVNFGVLNPAGTSQYVRLAGAPTSI